MPLVMHQVKREEAPPALARIGNGQSGRAAHAEWLRPGGVFNIPPG
jgi:hypothetical protein